MNSLSIIVPYYNGKDFIFDCIDSILDSYNLSQKKIRLEIIVIVDSPEEYLENKMDIVAHYNNPEFLKVFLNERNLGVAASRNKGLQLSQYNFITYIDQDDQVNYNYFGVIENQLSDQYHCIIYNGYWHYLKNDIYFKLFFTKPDLSFYALITTHFLLWTPGLMIINKNKVKISNYFIDVSEEFKGCDDWAAVLNLSLKYPNIQLKYIDKPLFIINRHSGNFSNDAIQMLTCHIHVLKYYKKKVAPKMQIIIDRLIAIKEFQIKQKAEQLSIKTILKKHLRIYFLYLHYKWIYPRYPLFKLNKMWNTFLPRINVK